MAAADTVSFDALFLAAALHFLAYAHSSGAHVLGLQRHDTHAAALEMQAMKLGHPGAVLAMGFRHLYGLGVDKVIFLCTSPLVTWTVVCKASSSFCNTATSHFAFALCNRTAAEHCSCTSRQRKQCATALQRAEQPLGLL
jgi:hypothetical protein